MAFVQLEGLGKRYGEIDAVVATDFRWKKANSSPCSAPPGAAKPPPCK
jgi:putative spermidine/putrescine transport system ATP-binding protein